MDRKASGAFGAEGDAFAIDRALSVRKQVTFDTRENRLTKYMLTQMARRLEIFRQRFMRAQKDIRAYQRYKKNIFNTI